MARWIAHHPVLGILVWLVLAVGLTGVVVIVGAPTSNDANLPGT